MSSLFPHLIRWRDMASKWPRPRLRTAAAVLVFASLAGGVLSGHRDAESEWASTARVVDSMDAQVAVVEEVSILADLDRRSTGPWDGFEGEDSTSVVSKGGISRSFRTLGPFLSKESRQTRYASTRPNADMDMCRHPLRILAQGSSSERIQVAIRDPDLSAPFDWKPLDGIGKACEWRRSKGWVSFRIVPSENAKVAPEPG